MVTPPSGRAGRVLLRIVLFMMAAAQGTASPSQPQWQQFWFCKADGSLINQVLTIKNMEDLSAEDCTFRFTVAPFCHNCSDSGFVVYARNKTCVGMSTKDLSTTDWRMEHGRNVNGDGLSATPAGRLSDGEVMGKMSECKKLRNRAAPRDDTRIAVILVGSLFLFYLLG